MYDDGNATYRVGINWKDILIKIVLLILFIMLLLVLFPKVDLTGLNDTIYNNNIQTMKEAARNYYTVDRLPSQVGESTSMTLKEMINNHRVIEFTDKNGKYCDESTSKVEVTKISNTEYALKVVLNCDDKQDYILDTIGCTNICSNGTCQTVITNGNGTIATKPSTSDDDGAPNAGSDVELDPTDYDSLGGNSKDGILKKKVTYYQFRKKVVTSKTVYTCPSGYTKIKGNKCMKNSTGAEIDATPVFGPDKVITTDAKYNYTGDYTVYADPIKTKTGTDYSCPTGYTLNGSYCIKYIDATEHPGSTVYTCPTGYTLNGTTCTKTYDATYHQGKTDYSCPQGGTLSGTTCTLTTSPSSNTTYTCPSGYTQNGSSCYKVYNATANTTYSCPSGYTKSGSGSSTTCTKTTTSSYAATPSTTYGSWINQGTKYYTSSSAAYTGETAKLVYGGMISGAVCGSPCGNAGIWYKYTYYTRTKNTTYSCPNGGTLSGTNCVKTSTSTANPTTSTSYTCPQGGTLSGNTCKLTASATPTTTYTCPSGYTKSGSGSSTTCTKTYAATPSYGDGYYTCPNGGTLSGSKCILTTNATPKTGESTYTCPTGYTLVGKKCEYKIPATATDIYSYTCPAGYTQSGSGENTKCSKVVKGQNVYYCEDAGAVLSGTKCIKTVKGDIVGYTCPADYQLNGTKCIKKTTEIIDATAKTTKKTSYKYTWSKSSKLAGWEFTGKTKVVYEKYVSGQK